MQALVSSGALLLVGSPTRFEVVLLTNKPATVLIKLLINIPKQTAIRYSALCTHNNQAMSN